MRLLGPLPTDVLEVVSEMTGISVAALTGESRSHDLIPARQVAYWCCYRCCDTSWPAVGAAFSRDHTTVIHGARVVEDTPRLRSVAEEVAAEVRRRFNVAAQEVLL